MRGCYVRWEELAADGHGILQDLEGGERRRWKEAGNRLWELDKRDCTLELGGRSTFDGVGSG